MSEDRTDILLVEDNPNDIEMTIYALRRNSITANVHACRDGTEALDYIFCKGKYAEREKTALPQGNSPGPEAPKG